MMLKRTRVSDAVLLVLGTALLTGAATAQERIEITGSRILRADLIGNTPVTVIGADAFANLGIENVADLIVQLPQFAPSFGASRTQSTFSGVATSGLNTPNLRNLGSVRSLVLINGRRVPGGTSTSTSVDLNTLPTANIDRIEIITGGAAAVYGSDAVAGVVNIITKKSVDGIEVGASYGEAAKGDNKNPSLYVMAGGKLGESLRGTVTLQATKEGRVSCADRFICAEDFSWFSPGAQVRGPNTYSGVGLGGRFFVGANSYVRRNNSFTDANGALLTFSTPLDGYNRNADRDIAIPTERINLAAEGEFNLGKGMKAFAEFNYGRATVESEFEGHPFQSQAAGSLFGTLQATIPITNPFIPAPLLAAAQAGGVTEMTWWQRFNTAGGPRGASSERTTTRGVVGLKGDFDSLLGGSSGWTWELSHVYGQTEVDLGTEGLVNTANLYHGLRVEADPANPGGYRCIDATARANGCIPINPFADYTPAMQQALRIGSRATGKSVLNDTVAYVQGPVASLPAGTMRGVVGLERRSFSGFLDYDRTINEGLATGNQISDTAFDKSTVNEVFGEILVPLVADVQLVKSLNFEGALRQSKTNKFSYRTYKWGGDWEPAEGLRFRVMTARSVRSPLPGELSGGGLTAGVVNDPCTATRRNLNAIRAANCAADGVPADYAPSQTIEQGVSGQTGGNSNLKPEEATTVTYGFVWQPSKSFSLTVDRFEIKVDGIITTVSRQIAANLCYDTPDRQLCSALTRGTNPLLPGATYVLRSVNEQLQNVAKQAIAGFDIEGRYALKLPSSLGDLDLAVTATIYDRAILQPLPTGAPVNLLSQAGGSTTDQGFVRLTMGGNASWRWNDWSANWNLRHIGRADMDPSSTALGYPEIGGHTYHNVRVGYAFSKNAEVYAGITNLFDKQPPFFASGRSGTQALDTIPGYYDVFGRSYFFGGRMKF